MATAIYDGKPFRLDPSSLRGSFQIKSQSTPTIGGKVVQVYGVQWNDLIVEGSFGRGAWHANKSPHRDAIRDQAEFLERMSAIGERQAALLSREPPQNFLWPDRGWSFQVYLKGFDSGSQDHSVHQDPDIFAPDWRLTFFVVTDNGNLSRRVSDQFIERLSKGLGWRQTEYNGPLDDRLATGFFTLPGRTPQARGPAVITFPSSGG